MRNLPKEPHGRGALFGFIPSIHCAPGRPDTSHLIAFKHQFERTPVVSGHLFVQTGKVILTNVPPDRRRPHFPARFASERCLPPSQGGSIVGIKDVALKILPSGQFNGGAGAVLNTPHIRDVVLGQEDELGGEEIAVTTGLHRGVRRQGNPFLRCTSAARAS